uniref:Putative carnitine o-acyltransferase cpt2/yat1 n=1 Tax=Amblyomma triste TaxID=251400 RepID=A0A023GLX5_AMBTT
MAATLRACQFLGASDVCNRTFQARNLTVCKKVALPASVRMQEKKHRSPVYWRSASTKASRLPDYCSDDYQFLERSVLPTMHFQKSLPRLPIPKLEKTCERYLRALEPLVTEEELKKTNDIVSAFKNKEGSELDQLLRKRDKANKHTSYISGPWFDMYLTSRKPLPLNFNPFMSWKDDVRPAYMDQVVRASNMVISSLRFFRSLQSNQLEPMVYHLDPKKSDTATYRRTIKMLPEALAWYVSALVWKAYPLDMIQFRNLFASTRIPLIGRDKLQVWNDSKHIVVIRNGHFHSMQVLDDKGSLFAPEHYQACLSRIMADKRPPPAVPVSALTAGPRDDWARARKELLAANNESTLQCIDSALFVLVLDSDVFQGTEQEKIAHHFLHGPVYNRWFDKSFSLLLTAEGHAALNFEHSWGDGVAVLRYFNEVYTDSTERPCVHPGQSANINPEPYIQRLDFLLTDSVKSAVQKAQQNYEEQTGSLQLAATLHSGLSRDLIKKSKLSPDSVMQLSFQLAYFLAHGGTAATYESCSTSAFKHGRTETVRPATMATKQCVEMLSSGKNLSAARLLLEKCSRVHSLLTKEAAMGQGFDRHLFALKVLAEEKGWPLPAVYEDPCFEKANHFILSTSTLYGVAFSAGGFAPVVPDGYGIAYGMVDEQLGAVISAYSPHRDARQFCDCLSEALDRICAAIKGS